LFQYWNAQPPGLPGPVAHGLGDLALQQPVGGLVQHRAVRVLAGLEQGMGRQTGIPDRRQAGLAIGDVRAAVVEQLVDRLARGDELRVVARPAQGLEGHHHIGHGREDATQSVLSVQARDDELDRFLDRPLPAAQGEAAPGGPEQGVEPGEEYAQRVAGRVHRVTLPVRMMQEQLVHAHAPRVARPRSQGVQDQQRHDHRTRPVRHLGQVEREPARQQHDLDRHLRHRAPRHLAEQGEGDAGEDVALRRAAAFQDHVACAGHVRRRRVVADQLERQVGLDRGAQVGRAAVEQRPAAAFHLNLAQVVADAPLALLVDLAQEVLEHDVFGRDRGVGLELEHPVAVRLLAVVEREAALAQGAVQCGVVDFRHAPAGDRCGSLASPATAGLGTRIFLAPHPRQVGKSIQKFHVRKVLGACIKVR
jgi:hypothetical protein